MPGNEVYISKTFTCLFHGQFILIYLVAVENMAISQYYPKDKPFMNLKMTSSSFELYSIILVTLFFRSAQDIWSLNYQSMK